MINLYEVALFSIEPKLGDINPPGEVRFVGYRRVPVAAMETNLHEVVFPCSAQDEPVWVTHIALLDGTGKVVSVREVSAKDVRP